MYNNFLNSSFSYFIGNEIKTSESDYITLFESLAAKAALVEYKKGIATEDNVHDVIAINKDITIPTRSAMKHQVFISYSRKDQEVADYLCDFLKEISLLQ